MKALLDAGETPAVPVLGVAKSASYNSLERFLSPRRNKLQMITSRHFSKLLALSSLVVLFAATTLPPSLAQESNPKAQRPRQVFPRDEQQPDEIFKVDTDLVSLDVMASDVEGRPIRNLRQEDFKVYLDGVEQPLAFFQVERRSGEPRPLAVVFALDISGSMTAEEMERLRSALNAFSARLADHSALYAVMSFGMNVKVIQKFTSEDRQTGSSFRANGARTKWTVNAHLRCR